MRNLFRRGKSPQGVRAAPSAHHRWSLPRRSTADTDTTLIDDPPPIKDVKPTTPPKQKKKFQVNGISLGSILQTSVTVGEATNIPYLKGLAGIILCILNVVQGTEQNYERCLHLTKMAMEFTDAIQSNLDDQKVSRRCEMHLDSLQQAVDQITRCLATHAKKKYFFRFLNTSQDDALLNECEKVLANALRLFRVRAHLGINAGIKRQEKEGNKFYAQVLELYQEPEPCPDRTPSNFIDRTDELPPVPQVFHGRQEELASITELLTEDEQAHLLVQGQGGVGKSALAHVVLHHDTVMSSFGQYRYAFDCEGLADLYSDMAVSFGCPCNKEGIISALRSVSERILLVIDNLEIIWESPESRLAVEDFLTELSGIPTVFLLITLRGKEQPLGPPWTKRYLLDVLDHDSAKQTFLDISDISSDDPDIDSLISDVAECMPLPVVLMAHLAQYESLPFLLERFSEEGTSMLSIGGGRTADMDTSIEISLSSPRIVQCPHAIDVLRALSVSEHGFSREKLGLTSPGLPTSVQKCVSILSASSLLTEDADGNIKVPALVKMYLSKHASSTV